MNIPGVLGNNTDIENYLLTAILNVGPMQGELTLNADGSKVYTPDSNYTVIDNLTYQANDRTLNSIVATVTLKIGE